MKGNIRKWKVMALWMAMFLLPGIAYAEEGTPACLPEGEPDTTSYALSVGETPVTSFYAAVDSFSRSRRLIHRFGIEARPAYIFPTNPFLKGVNAKQQPLQSSLSGHLRYSFKFLPGTYIDRIYSGVYQGIGVARYNFGNREQLGNPTAVYLFQGARIARFSSRLSLNYEWNFGLSWGWKPYDYTYNVDNMMIGSKINAYINTNFYLNWALSSKFDLTSGVTLTHFSNGNTKFPNAGLNTVGLKVGLAYNFNREDPLLEKLACQTPLPDFRRHISYDLVLFGSWRRKGVVFGDSEVASPDAYTVLGFNFAPMYNLGYKFRVGASLDGVYDGSANVYTVDYIVGTTQEFFKPRLKYQMALGVSARAEYVMPYFTVGIGLGTNVVHGGGDLKGLYQILALKIEVTRNSFIHIGYNLQDFHNPNYLMLGFGFRFHNKYSTYHR